MQEQAYIFNYSWTTVVKGFLQKYPHKDLDFVKWNRVIDMVVNPDDTISIKRLVFSQKLMMVWCYTIEEIKFDFQSKLLEMQTKMVEKSAMFPPLAGMEKVVYMAKNMNQTIYQKFMEDQNNKLMQYASLFSSSFKKGISIVEEKCREMMKQIS